ncbi:unnamed protein product, partial [Polarella glacialis]
MLPQTGPVVPDRARRTAFGSCLKGGSQKVVLELGSEDESPELTASAPLKERPPGGLARPAASAPLKELLPAGKSSSAAAQGGSYISAGDASRVRAKRAKLLEKEEARVTLDAALTRAAE